MHWRESAAVPQDGTRSVMMVAALQHPIGGQMGRRIAPRTALSTAQIERIAAEAYA
ncbi:hypothetical protein ACPPVO_21470 [Dactylosporangium sp. McL0621]|uniref:hypothetical protein n=1 Tax=Dactylosporangium sp. McL0621 TaxID=3415678 RepID=UPI003CEAAC86